MPKHRRRRRPRVFTQPEFDHFDERGRRVTQTVAYQEYNGPQYKPDGPKSLEVSFVRPDGAIVTHNLGRTMFEQYLEKGLVPVQRITDGSE